MRAFEVAAELYDRCVALAESERVECAELHELLCSAGEAWYRVGQLEFAIARYKRAAELARSEHDTERFVAAMLSAASVLRGVVLYDRSLHGQLRDALEMLPATDSPLRAGVLAASAICMRSSPVAERDAALAEAIAIARRLDDDWTLQWLLNARHLALWGGLHPGELLATANEMMEVSRKTGELEVLLDGYCWRTLDLSELGDFATAHHDLESYRVDVERSGSPFHRYMLLCVDCLTLQTDGDFGRARELSERAWQWGSRIREPLADAFYAVRTLFQQIDEGLLHGDPQRRCAPEILEPPDCVPSDYRPLWALPWAIQDKNLDAERCVTQFLAHDAAGLVLDAVRRPLLVTMARVCWVLNDTVQAARLYPLLLPSAGLHAILQAGVYVGSVSYALGLLATLSSQLEAAIAHFEDALLGCGDSPPWQARIHSAFGIALARIPGQEARACEHLREGHAIASRLGMADLRESSRVELERLSPAGGRSSDGPPAMV
jgi:tetratricopeptide (TPR) repeat protein